MEGDAEGRVFFTPQESRAISYVLEVKQALRDQREKYDMFVQSFEDHETRIDTAELIERVKEIFEGHDELIRGFNAFLPEESRIVVDEPLVREQPVTYEETVGFVLKVKECFRNQEHVFLAFYHILSRYLHGEDIGVTYSEVARLFAGHPDLVEEFKRYLPNNFGSEKELSSMTALTSCQLQMDCYSEDEVTQDCANLDHNEDMMKKVPKDNRDATGSDMN
ncbi:hypothetical protein ACJRO7_005095 [Eucalyptus globulus]|uniref:Uncharacterized protein n=1 Tax=Eucalyptus globulus TaxID=34317 RepID=A0ABD3J0Y3_EUCGL